MADSFTANHVQGVFGEFKPVLDFATNAATADNVQGVLGLFEAVLDEAGAADGAPNTRRYTLTTMGIG